jgi:hypothetical protein
MKAIELIKIASDKGYSIARLKSNVYQYRKGNEDWKFVYGNWSTFVKTINSI